MKKVLSLLLVLIIVLSLTACGEKGGDNSSTAQTTEASESNNSTTKETEEQSTEPTTESVEENKLSADFVIGTWAMDFSISKNPKSAPMFGDIFELFKGGTGKGYLDKKMKDSGSFYPLEWEITDDCLIVRMTADPISVAFELDGDNLTTTDGDFTFVKQE